MKKQGRKAPFAFYLGVIVLIFTLFTTSLTGGLYARYSSGDTDFDGARVARFEIDEDFSDISVYIPIALELQSDPAKPIFLATYSVDLVNHSEVAVHCVLKPENMTNNLPLEFSVIEVNLDRGQMDTVSVSIAWKDGYTSESFAGKTDLVRLTLTVQQLD